MSLIALLIVLAFLAALWWLFNYRITTPNPIKWLINLVLIVVAVALVLNALGIWNELRGIQVPKI